MDSFTVHNKTITIAPVIRRIDESHANMPCFWDHHPFEGHPVVVPLRYNCRKIEFECWGNFCSPNCAKAWMLKRGGANLQSQINWFRRIMRTHYGVPLLHPICAAPPIWTLYYGKFRDIEEFRAASAHTEYREVQPPLSIISVHLQETIHNDPR